MQDTKEENIILNQWVYQYRPRSSCECNSENREKEVFENNVSAQNEDSTELEELSEDYEEVVHHLHDDKEVVLFYIFY